MDAADPWGGGSRPHAGERPAASRSGAARSRASRTAQDSFDRRERGEGWMAGPAAVVRLERVRARGRAAAAAPDPSDVGPRGGPESASTSLFVDPAIDACEGPPAKHKSPSSNLTSSVSPWRLPPARTVAVHAGERGTFGRCLGILEQEEPPRVGSTLSESCLRGSVTPRHGSGPRRTDPSARSRASDCGAPWAVSPAERAQDHRRSRRRAWSRWRKPGPECPS